MEKAISADPQLASKPYKYWARRLRRMLRESEELKSKLKALLEAYAIGSGRGADGPGGKELLSADTAEVISAICDLIDAGHVHGRVFCVVQVH
jgi:hypothetical protein